MRSTIIGDSCSRRRRFRRCSGCAPNWALPTMTAQSSRRCAACSAEVYSYHSCKNRSCPKCHTDQTKRWLEARKIEMLPCRYFHVTITVPAQLRDWLRANQRDGYALLMKAAAESLIEIAR